MVRRVRAGAAEAPLSELELYVHAIYSSRYVMARRWVQSLWPELCFWVYRRLEVETTPLTSMSFGGWTCEEVLRVDLQDDLRVTKILFQMDTIGRLFYRTYWCPWEWPHRSDLFSSYNMDRALVLLHSSQPWLAQAGDRFIAEAILVRGFCGPSRSC